MFINTAAGSVNNSKDTLQANDLKGTTFNSQKPSDNNLQMPVSQINVTTVKSLDGSQGTDILTGQSSLAEQNDPRNAT